jgi:hypothetical protein
MDANTQLDSILNEDKLNLEILGKKKNFFANAKQGLFLCIIWGKFP